MGGATWRALIPTAFVTAAWCPKDYPPPFSKVKYFGGDGRGYSTDTTQFAGRSRIEATMGHSFAGGKYYEEPLYKRTGDTTTWDKNKKLVARKNAGTSGYQLGYGQHTSNYGERNLKIAVKDPLCSMAANVDIAFYFRAASDASITIVGTHDRAPSHEILYSWGNPVTGKVNRGCAYRYQNRGLPYLIPPMPNTTFDIRINGLTGARPDCKER